MYTIRKIANEFNLSRSTLLYYDSVGLLKPSSRTESGYRQYSEEDKSRLKQICTYRQMGIPLKEIKKLFDLSGNDSSKIVEDHLIQLSDKIRSLRKQQFSIVKILKNKDILKKAGLINKDSWADILRSSGLNDDEMIKWHLEFEKISPQAHHDFLVSLGINEQRIKEIRKGKIE